MWCIGTEIKYKYKPLIMHMLVYNRHLLFNMHGMILKEGELLQLNK